MRPNTVMREFHIIAAVPDSISVDECNEYVTEMLELGCGEIMWKEPLSNGFREVRIINLTKENDMAKIDVDLNDVVEEYPKLSLGQSLVCIETNKVIPDNKEYFNEDGTPNAENGKFCSLVLSLKVYGGPDNGKTEDLFLKYRCPIKWMEGRDRKYIAAIKKATGVPEQSNESDDLNGKFMLVRVSLDAKQNKYRQYDFEHAPGSMIPKAYVHFADTEEGKAIAAQDLANTARPAAPAANPAANAKPSWAV